MTPVLVFVKPRPDFRNATLGWLPNRLEYITYGFAELIANKPSSEADVHWSAEARWLCVTMQEGIEQSLQAINTTGAATLLSALQQCLLARCAIEVRWLNMCYEQSEDPGFFKTNSIGRVDLPILWAMMQDLVEAESTARECFYRWNQNANFLKDDIFEQQWNESLGAGMRLEQRLRDRIQVDVAMKSLEESMESIKEAKSVGRLTQLAFVFIPLTFTTGVFGMNVQPFGGHAAMWKFWLTASLISFGAFIFWLLFEKENIQDSARRIKEGWQESTLR